MSHVRRVGVAAAVLLAACAGRGGYATSPAGAVAPPDTARGVTAAGVGRAGEADPRTAAVLRAPVAALLQPGDVVRLAIWREPELSGDFRIDESGVVTLPKIGPQRIGQESGEAFTRRVTAEFRRYLLNPSIDVVFLRRIAVGGAVRNPGLYTVDLTVTLSGVLALAGGVAENGSPDRVYLVRDGRRTRIAESTTVLGELAVRSGDQVYVPTRSWASRNLGVIAGIVSSLAGVAILLRR